MKLNLSARPPFNFHSVVNSHGWVQMAPFRYDEESGVLSYTDRLSNGRLVDYRITGSSLGAQVEIKGKLDSAERNEVRERIEWMLGLDQDFSTFYKAARKEPKLRKAQKLARGRVLRSPTFFEDILKTILTTNTLWSATKRMNLNLISTFGEKLPGTDYVTFPSPEKIAASTEAVLRKVVRTGYRSPAILELAVRVASGELDTEAFKTSTLPTLDLRAELLKMRGIGPYAAANLLMILGRSDFIPLDSWALKMVSIEWYKGKPVTPKQVERRFKQWGEFKGLAYWFWDWKYDGG